MTTTARSAPVGAKIDDGFSTLFAFAADPDIALWEKNVKPPGIDGGDPIDITTMHNTDWRTFAPPQLKTLTPMNVTCAYDPAVYDQIAAILATVGWITCHFADGSTLDFVGYLKSFEPNDISEGEQPTASVVIQPTNILAGVEEEPVYTAAV